MNNRFSIARRLQSIADVGLIFVGLTAPAGAAEANRAKIKTAWADQVSATNAHPEYPRPGLVRPEWLNLNGKWDYTITAFTGPVKGTRSGSVLVPFPVESQLSGVEDKFSSTKKIEYRRQFKVPERWKGQRILLHFDAVNWAAQVELNGKELGTHTGGYERFSFDVTDALKGDGEQALKVTVTNPGETGKQPRGKQTFAPDGIWYTTASGIWQTAWLEPVPATFVSGLKVVTDVDSGTLILQVATGGATNPLSLVAEAFAEGRSIVRATGNPNEELRLSIPQARLWSPETPFLYDLKVSLEIDGKTKDEVTSYFGMRKISIAKGHNGHPRIQLNNEDYFQLGVLDQGYWPDGIYTAPTDEALRYDIELTKRLGFNLSRKHVKVEPERWYYWCDKLGLLVWQDIPSAGKFVLATEKDALWPAADATAFQKELAGIVRQNWNHPSIVVWTAFNEGWGQHDTANIVKFIKDLDPERLVISASGWNDRGVGDVLSLHLYPGPATSAKWDERAFVAGECGGLGLPIAGHLWNPKVTWSYSKYGTAEQLQASYSALMARIVSAQKGGLSGAVITQLTDVENEVNGLATYDRAVMKINTLEPNRQIAGKALFGQRAAVPTPRL